MVPVLWLGHVSTGMAGFMRRKRRKPNPNGKSHTDPAYIAWRNMTPEQRASTFGRVWFIEQYRAGLIDRHARPTVGR